MFGTSSPTIFLNYQPPAPDDCMTVYYRSGDRPSPGHAHEVRRIQVIVRGRGDAAQVMDRAEAVYSNLHSLSHTVLPGGQSVILIRASGGPLWLGRDDKGRNEFSIEFECHLRNEV